MDWNFNTNPGVFTSRSVDASDKSGVCNNTEHSAEELHWVGDTEEARKAANQEKVNCRCSNDAGEEVKEATVDVQCNWWQFTFSCNEHV